MDDPASGRWGSNEASRSTAGITKRTGLTVFADPICNVLLHLPVAVGMDFNFSIDRVPCSTQIDKRELFLDPTPAAHIK
jgi:hypothetical protein